MSILQAVLQQVGGQNIETLSRQVGAQPQQVQTAVTAAIPMLMGAMARNADSKEGAQSLASALDRDHDGSLLDNLSGFLGSQDNRDGAGILGHVLGGKQPKVEQGISQMSGLNMGQVTSLLQNLAPVIMAVLGRQKRQQGLDIAGLANVLGGARQEAGSSAGAAMSMLGNILDRDGDGSALDDIGGMLGGMFGGKR